MRIIVDTSIWSLALRRPEGEETPEAERLRSLIAQEEDIFLLGVILQEILQGIKKPHAFDKVKEYLEAFPLVEVHRDTYIFAAKLRNHMAHRGIQTGTVDALIASASINNDCALFTADKDFDHISKHTKLRLLRL